MENNMNEEIKIRKLTDDEGGGYIAESSISIIQKKENLHIKCL